MKAVTKNDVSSGATFFLEKYDKERRKTTPTEMTYKVQNTKRIAG